jgi:hypothetical protein
MLEERILKILSKKESEISVLDCMILNQVINEYNLEQQVFVELHEYCKMKYYKMMSKEL